MTDSVNDNAEAISELNSKLPSRIQKSVTGAATSWSGKYYQDINVSADIPSGKQIIGLILGAATNGGAMSITLYNSTTVRLLDATDFTGKSIVYFIVIG